MIDFLITALVIFAVIAGSAIGWVALAATGRGVRAVGGELIRARSFQIKALITIALLAFLIAT